ncbi:hypothetical protein PtA15_13A190 [Puccinia triticina]|nr:uncharacterized protein PtA15_13A190 [Puccinia triticina]WAQ90791.1 hypothetical protein PtA15_13A190 [Puccinia triticina]WAR60977.1 hypothetical protein PtB15_13B228 [Puccinia triticina]
MHAEVWTENGKVLIRDVKSSNGTFINGERLSAEGVESEAFELHSDDLVEFGIDIIADDNKSIVHHKVATKVFLVLNAEDAAAATSFYRSNGPDLSLNRRASRPGVFGGGGFDHVLNRLQSELEKSRATGQELNTLNSTMNEIHDTLGGGNGPPPPLPPHYGGRIPPIVQQPQRQQQTQLQSQLAETQASLAMYAEKMKALEAILGEHEQMKRELTELREQIEPARAQESYPRSAESSEDRDIAGRVSPVAAMLELQESEQDRGSMEHEGEADDDCMSTASNETTMTWKAPSKSYQPNGAPGSPHPQGIDLKQVESIIEQNHLLSERIEAISVSLDETVQVGQSLLERHNQSSDLISELEREIKELKKDQQPPSEDQPKSLDTDSSTLESIEIRIIEKVEKQYSVWSERLEAGWKEQQAGWEHERESLQKIIHNLEAKLLEQKPHPLEPSGSVVEDKKPFPPGPLASSSMSKTSSKRNRKKKSSLSATMSADLDAPSEPSSPSLSSSKALPEPAHTDHPSSLVDLFLHPLKPHPPPVALDNLPDPPLDSQKPSPNSLSNSTNKNHPSTNSNVRPFIYNFSDLKFISAAGGVALLGFVTYAFVNHFQE